MAKKSLLFKILAAFAAVSSNLAQTAEEPATIKLVADPQNPNLSFVNKTTSGYKSTVEFSVRRGDWMVQTSKLDVNLALYSPYDFFTQDESYIEKTKIPEANPKSFSFANFEVTSDAYTATLMKLGGKESGEQEKFENPEILVSRTCSQGQTKLDCKQIGGGVLGLGLAPTHSFLTRQQFKNHNSIDISRDGMTGNFRLEYNLAPNPKYNVFQAKTSANWELQNVKKFGWKNLRSEHVSVTVAFDLNEVATTLPVNLYENILSKLSKVPHMECPANNYYRPLCHYSGRIEDLKVLHFRFEGDNFKNDLIVPAEGYLKVEKQEGVNGHYIRVNLKAASPTFPGKNYFSKEFENHVFLGTQFLSQYHVNFQVAFPQSVTIWGNDLIPITKLDSYYSDAFVKATEDNEEVKKSNLRIKLKQD